MPSKKAASTKRAVLPRTSKMSGKFKDDWDRLNKSGRFNMNDLRAVMLIYHKRPWRPERKDHPLSGAWQDCRDCHVHGDFLLLYRISGKGDNEEVTFLRAGTHAELFE